jgi:hypothetical protein
MVGWLYYTLLFEATLVSGANNGENLFDNFGSTFRFVFSNFGIGCWIAFVAALELVLQVLVSRRSEPDVGMPGDQFPRTRFVKVLIVAMILLIALPVFGGAFLRPADAQCINVSIITGQQVGTSFPCHSDMSTIVVMGAVTLFSGWYFLRLIAPWVVQVIVMLYPPRKAG